MARVQDPRIEQAKTMYLEGRKLVDIASELELPEGTIRRWKCTHEWDSERSDKNNERSERNSERSERKLNKANRKKTASNIDVDSVIENEELTDKQRFFCLLYIKCFNAIKAYQKAYGCGYETAAVNGYRLLENASVKDEIRRLKRIRLNREMLSEEDIFQKYMDIAFADITDYVEFGQQEEPVMAMYGPVRVKDEETGEKVTLMQTVNSVRFRDSAEVDGTIIAEVKQGRNGASIKLADRMKALQWLSDHMDLATEEQRTRIEVMRAKANLDQEAETEDDGFLDALNSTAAEDWTDEESNI